MSKDGKYEERTIVKILEEKGYAAIRVPASGGATNRDRPDIITGNSKHYFAIEVKSTSKEVIYIRKKQIEELKRFSAKFGCHPVICTKFQRKPYTILELHHLTPTKKHYKISLDVNQQLGTPLTTYIQQTWKTKT